MLEPLIVLGLFAGLVWVIAHAIFIVMRSDQADDASPEHRDTLATFVQENYGSHFQDLNHRAEEGLRKL